MDTHRKHILIAEDDVHLGKTLAFILKANKYTVTLAGDGREALLLSERSRREGRPVDLLVCDINMPMVNGLELIAHLRMLKRTMPICVMTAAYTDAIIARLQQMECSHFLVKPFSQEIFLKMVASLTTVVDAPA